MIQNKIGVFNKAALVRQALQDEMTIVRLDAEVIHLKGQDSELYIETDLVAQLLSQGHEILEVYHNEMNYIESDEVA